MSELKIKGKHEAGWITISTDEYESMIATIDILSRSSVVKKIRQAEKDKAEGKMKSLEQVKKGIRSLELILVPYSIYLYSIFLFIYSVYNSPSFFKSYFPFSSERSL